LTLSKGSQKMEARDVAKALYANAPEGGSTLTVRNGRRALSTAQRLDELKVESQLKGVKEQVEEMIDELLFTVARSCLGSNRDFAFNGKNRKIFARLNRVKVATTILSRSGSSAHAL